ncbi:MAG: hypothetical protein MK101_10495 [Phycisphaerales bacterium]|nr:hypothetical protein [Phycisphaerales bacterium]
MTTNSGGDKSIEPGGDAEGMGCWWLVAIGIVVLFGVLTAFLVITG